MPDKRYWHCDYCHRGITAGELHNITDHHNMCFDCFDLLRGVATSRERYHQPGIAHEFYPHLRPTIKRCIDTMLKDGLVERNTFDDIVVTDKGQKLYDQLVNRE